MGSTFSIFQSQNEANFCTPDSNTIKAGRKASASTCLYSLTQSEIRSLGDDHITVRIALCQLHYYHLLSPLTRDLLIKSKKNASVVCQQLRKLEDAGLFSVTTLTAIAKTPEHASTIIYLLIKLSQSKQLIEASLATITPSALNRYSKFAMLENAQNAFALKAIHDICDECRLPKNIILDVVALFFKSNMNQAKQMEEETEESDEENALNGFSRLKRTTLTAFPVIEAFLRQAPGTADTEENNNSALKKRKR